MSKTLDFYFDYYSPYSYFVTSQISRIEQDYGVVFNWRPVDIVSILKLDEGDCYNAIKRAYVNQDVIYSAEFFGTPVAMPQPWPISSGLALALSHNLKECSIFESHAQRIFEAAWTKSLDISDVSVLEQCFRESGGDLSEFDTALSLQSQGLSSLETATAEALQQGVFGVPFFICNERKLFGADRLPMLETWLRQ